MNGGMFRTICCLLVALGCVSFANAEDRAAASPPEQVIRDFYQWYVPAVVANRDPFTKNRQELGRYATARLIREIDAMVKGPDGLNGDYFLDAQEVDKDWSKNIRVSALVSEGARATAEVELTGSEIGTRKLQVSLVQEKGSWKVDKVTGKG